MSCLLISHQQQCTFLTPVAICPVPPSIDSSDPNLSQLFGHLFQPSSHLSVNTVLSPFHWSTLSKWILSPLNYDRADINLQWLCSAFTGTSGGDLFEVVLKGPMQAQSYVTDYGNGTYQASYLCSQRGNYKLRVTLNGINVGVMAQSEKLRPSPVGEYKVEFCDVASPWTPFGPLNGQYRVIVSRKNGMDAGVTLHKINIGRYFLSQGMNI